MRYLRTLSVVLLLAGCASGSEQAENEHWYCTYTYPITQTTEGVARERALRRQTLLQHQWCRQGRGDISTFLWQNLWNKEKWPKAIENPPADPIVERVTEGIRAINHATVLVQVAGRISSPTRCGQSA